MLSATEIRKKFSLTSATAAELYAKKAHDLGIESISDFENFLNPSLKNLPDPFKLKDMDRAAERVVRAVQESQLIGIYGDYDVDGTCAAAILRRFLRSLGVEPLIYQPNRLEEGYGLNSRAVKNLSDKGVKLLITVDCGISNAKEISDAKKIGLDVIVCDHHQVPPEMPDAIAVINHKRLDDQSGITTLCGAGMAFYLAIATRNRLRANNYFNENRVEPDIREYLDLVALASVADLVPLQHETRILVHFGLKKMRSAPTLGLREILKVAGVENTVVDTFHCGFVLGPRINASGRLESASFALELLTTENATVANDLAKKLDKLNGERIELTSSVFQEAKLLIEDTRINGEIRSSALIVSEEHWHEGVIGIVASRIQDHYKLPTAIVTFNTKDGLGKGSMRCAHPLVHAADILQQCSDLLIKFGGHKAAAGFSVAKEKFAEFSHRFEALIGKQIAGGREYLDESLLGLVELKSITELSESLVREINALGPFGMGNPEPILKSELLKLEECKTLKEKHLKLKLSSDSGKQVGGFFPNGALSGEYSLGEHLRFLFSPVISEFRGKKSLEMRIRDVQK